MNAFFLIPLCLCCSNLCIAKRNLGALKNSPVHGSTRDKRQIPVDDNLEMSEPVYQTSPVDYDELLAALESNVYPPPSATHNEQKRFLGKLLSSWCMGRVCNLKSMPQRIFWFAATNCTTTITLTNSPQNLHLDESVQYTPAQWQCVCDAMHLIRNFLPHNHHILQLKTAQVRWHAAVASVPWPITRTTGIVIRRQRNDISALWLAWDSTGPVTAVDFTGHRPRRDTSARWPGLVG